jgi:hypothetical protein
MPVSFLCAYEILVTSFRYQMPQSMISSMMVLYMKISVSMMLT